MSDLTNLINLLGADGYRDGSSAGLGVLYQPIYDWLPDLAGTPCHKEAAIREDFKAVLKQLQALQAAVDRPLRILEIGGANGYYALGLRKQLAHAPLHYCLEADPRAFAVGRGATAVGAPNSAWFCAHATSRLLRLIHEPLAAEGIPFDAVLCLNVHMWMVKQGLAAEVMARVANWAECFGTRTLFQTAGAESAGMCLVGDLDSSDTIDRYLQQYFPAVRWLSTTTAHGGLRHLFVCGPKEATDE